MTWVFAILIVLAMGGVAAVAVGRGEPMAEERPDRVDALVPADRAITSGDLRAVRFPLVLRGYRMKDVDALLDRLAEQLDEREREDGRPSDPPGERWADVGPTAEPVTETTAEPVSEPVSDRPVQP